MEILILGFQHETNTFAASSADWHAFNEGATFLSACRGDELRRKIEHANLPAGGFLRVAEAAGHRCTLGFWAGATPSGLITADAFERICSNILADVAANPQVDAIYLDLHGAAVAVGFDDCEGELLARVRALVGPKPMVVSLDLHANVSDAMLQLADAVVSYRKYPHTDMADTGALAFELLKRRMARGEREPIALGRLDHLIPIISQSTWTEPAMGIYEQLAQDDASYGTVSSFCPAFPASDIPECAPCFWAYGEHAKRVVARLYQNMQPASMWKLHTLPPAEAIAQALIRAQASAAAVVVADVQDNPGTGGDGCTTGVLNALVQSGAGQVFPGRVILGLLHDPAAAQAAHAAGVGNSIHLAIGRSAPGFDGLPTDPPAPGPWKVLHVSDGKTTLTGPMMTQAKINLGPCAALEQNGVVVAVSSQRKQMLDLGLFELCGINPHTAKLIVVKSSNHYRAAFSPLVEHPSTDIINAKAHAAFAADPADLPYRRLPPNLRAAP